MEKVEIHQKPLVNSNALSTSCTNEMIMHPKEKNSHVAKIRKRTFSELTDTLDKLSTMHPRCMRIQILVNEEKVHIN